ncbi:uncharacterized protein LOC111309283 isoform X1 [Durio zibethinus]|uniref:Uncharacterized protein LOC111309283 isoform X1 n=1 Tax=Durio zibethinus TaxID=66656 RepID=A0A6P6AGQ4_DURZI|nr:uncharacterized protein LOC111309283 isoform X1 [Durio zibethinus]
MFLLKLQMAIAFISESVVLFHKLKSQVNGMEFPVDPSGGFNRFKDFVRSNFEFCKWIGLSIMSVQDEKVLQQIYVLPGWKGSTADGRVLKDTITCRNGLKIPQNTQMRKDF